jgi:uncharacterized damage-inducible protein DinB
MTLQELKLLHAFNSWATQKIFDTLAAVPPEVVRADLKASHGSIFGTLTHLVAAEKIWLSRWVGRPDRKMLTPEEAADLPALKKIWEEVGYETARWLGTMTDKRVQETFSMTNVRGETLTPILWQAFQHVVDHSTYHRGQIITLLRQSGITPPATSLILFYRETAKAR